jgi:anti-anti-sigma regulatory factor
MPRSRPDATAGATELRGPGINGDTFARSELPGDRDTADHPLSAPFQPFRCADGAIALAGEFDAIGLAALRRVLPSLQKADGGTLVIDLAGLEYVDHRLLLTLDTYAKENGAAVSLRSASSLAARLMELLPACSLRHPEPGAQESGARG